MVTPLLIDLNRIDLNRVIMGQDEIRRANPHRYEMEQLDGILLFEPKQKIVVGYKDARPDEFWVRGHIPGRPLMPGVLMLESAAQLVSFYCKKTVEQNNAKFMGLGGINNAKFRSTVVPGDRLIVICKATEMRPRRVIFNTQGVVNNRLAFEAMIIGILV